MSDSAPHYVTCPCQHCSGKIEFDANQLDAAEKTTVPCPHCGMETILFVPEEGMPPNIPPVEEADESQEEVATKQTEADLGSLENMYSSRAYVYSVQELKEVVRRYASKLKLEIDDSAIELVARSSSGSPADLLHRLRLIRDFAQARALSDRITVEVASQALQPLLEEAERRPAIAYADGEGMGKNDAEAVKWFRKAAAQGNAQAQSMLGAAFFLGKGVPQNNSEAAVWFSKAAQRGSFEGQFYLALCYAGGLGVPQNYVEAYKWLNIAAAQGDKTAIEFRDNLSRRLSPKQIAQGQRLAILQVEKMVSSPVAKPEANESRQAIPSEVRREVWRRDGGKCVKCGSRERLEYDHIIPVIKGGSNTARNIELLCEACNRSKSDLIQ